MLESIKSSINKNNEKINLINEEIKIIKENINKSSDEYDKKLDSFKNIKLHYDQQMIIMEQLEKKKETIRNDVNQKMREIRDLGSVPSGDINKYEDKRSKQLTKIIKECKEEIEYKYSKINKKATEQYENSKSQVYIK